MGAGFGKGRNVQLSTEMQLVIILFGCVIVAVLAFVFLRFYRRYESLAQAALERSYKDLTAHSVPLVGDVILLFHTYHGLVFWFTQTKHHIALPPDDARVLLGRLARFNLKWGLVTYGALFVPILTVSNYVAQRRSIARQLAKQGT